MEKAARHSAEAHLLETEKKNSEIGVDLIQLQHRIASLESQIQVEMDKVIFLPIVIINVVLFLYY